MGSGDVDGHQSLEAVASLLGGVGRRGCQSSSCRIPSVILIAYAASRLSGLTVGGERRRADRYLSGCLSYVANDSVSSTWRIIQQLLQLSVATLDGGCVTQMRSNLTSEARGEDFGG
jgi:hypothetical protein